MRIQSSTYTIIVYVQKFKYSHKYIGERNNTTDGFSILNQTQMQNKSTKNIPHKPGKEFGEDV